SASSPSTTSRARKCRDAWRAASIAHNSGPMPAGSPQVIASVGCAGIAASLKRQDRHRRSVAEHLHVDSEHRLHDAGSVAVDVDARLPVTLEPADGLAEQPQELERVVRIDVASVLHRTNQPKRGAP